MTMRQESVIRKWLQGTHSYRELVANLEVVSPKDRTIGRRWPEMVNEVYEKDLLANIRTIRG